MTELSPEARALLASVRDEDDPSELDRARLRNKLSIALAATAGAATASSAAVAAANAGAAAKLAVGTQTVVATTLTAKVSMAITIAAISVAAGGVALQRAEPAQPNAQRAPAAEVAKARAPRRARAVPEHAVAMEAPLQAPAVVQAIAVGEPPALPAVTARAPIARNDANVLARQSSVRATRWVPFTAPSPLLPSLQAEIDLLSSAQAALRRGDSDRALSIVYEHAMRFPHGALALERDAARAIALCSAGRIEEGRAAASTLASQAESSPLIASAKRACEP